MCSIGGERPRVVERCVAGLGNLRCGVLALAWPEPMQAEETSVIEFCDGSESVKPKLCNRGAWLCTGDQERLHWHPSRGVVPVPGVGRSGPCFEKCV